MNNIALPDLPSQLILLALKDLKAVEASPEYQVDMCIWHETFVDFAEEITTCHVCFAGAVMAGTLESEFTDLSPDDFNPEVEGKLVALDHFRSGDLTQGIEAMNLEVPRALNNSISWPTRLYAVDPDQFKLDMKSHAKLLERHGL